MLKVLSSNQSLKMKQKSRRHKKASNLDNIVRKNFNRDRPHFLDSKENWISGNVKELDFKSDLISPELMEERLNFILLIFATFLIIVSTIVLIIYYNAYLKTSTTIEFNADNNFEESKCRSLMLQTLDCLMSVPRRRSLYLACKWSISISFDTK